MDSETLILSKHGIFIIFQSILDEFWGFYHGTSLGARLPKAFSSCSNKESNRELALMQRDLGVQILYGLSSPPAKEITLSCPVPNCQHCQSQKYFIGLPGSLQNTENWGEPQSRLILSTHGNQGVYSISTHKSVFKHHPTFNTHHPNGVQSWMQAWLVGSPIHAFIWPKHIKPHPNPFGNAWLASSKNQHSNKRLAHPSTPLVFTECCVSPIYAWFDNHLSTC